MGHKISLLSTLFTALCFAGCDSASDAQVLDHVDASREAVAGSESLEQRGSFDAFNPANRRLPPEFLSCEGHCGGAAPGRCWCDDECEAYGDCCDDYQEVCAEEQACGTRGTGPCPKGTFCQFPQENNCGRTDLGGTCQVPPEGCIEIYDPVCGCDGETYGNECIAHSNGVSVDYEGECKVEEVGCGGWLGDTCAKDEYCAYKPGEYCGAADASSVCKPRPDACLDVYDPVCACDGRTYPNACVAARNGFGVDSKGKCEGTPPPQGKACGGMLGVACDDGEYCDYPISAQCGAADQMGTCKMLPDLCTQEVEPVCGCDGKTYGNACKAGLAGVSVAYEGLCKTPLPNPPKKCTANQDCQPGGYCDTSLCLPCDAGPDMICPAVCFGICRELPKKKYCFSDANCEQGQICNLTECLSPCPELPDVFCPAVCMGVCDSGIES